MNKIIFFTIIILLLGCGIFKTELKWTDLPDEYYAIPPYAKYLKGLSIVLDPGHGGQGDIPGYKRGPSGVREAEINLRVVFFLKEFLENAGAKVLLTRNDDSYVSLADRADFANRSNADFMISIHHNASQNPLTNYSSIYYHKDINFSPASIDLARNIYFGLVEALHLPQISVDGLYSDQLIFPDGFGLLRRCKIPAILIESSFFSNIKEEKRLKKKDYNKREAYGIFLGLTRYIAGGIPYTELISPENGVSRSKTPQVMIKLFDGLRHRQGPDSSRLRIFINSIQTKIDNKTIKPDFDKVEEMVCLRVDTPLTNGEHNIKLLFQNIYKNHNLVKYHKINIASPCKKIEYYALSEIFPQNGDGFIPVDMYFFDKDSCYIWDGTKVNIWSKQANIELMDSSLIHGQCRVNIYPEDKNNSLWIYSSADSCIDSLKIDFVPKGSTIFQGKIWDQHKNRLLSSVKIYSYDTLLTETDRYGTFFLNGIKPDKIPLKFCKRGYFFYNDTVEIRPDFANQYNQILTPVDSGIFFGKVIIIDTPSADEKKDSVILNTLGFSEYHLIKQIADSLRFAGAEPVLVRESGDNYLSLTERINKVNRLKKGWYMRVTIDSCRSDSNMIKITTYPGNKQAKEVARSLKTIFNKNNYRAAIIENTLIPEVRNTNKTALAVDLILKKDQEIKKITYWFYSGLRNYYFYEKQQREKDNKVKK